MQHAASSLREETAFSVELASKTNPGVPPSSFMSFLNEVTFKLLGSLVLIDLIVIEVSGSLYLVGMIAIKVLDPSI